MTSLTATQRFFNCHGQAYASLTNGTLIKNEKERDRLRILNRQGYAVDVSLLSEALEAGATALEIKEKTVTGAQRIYRTQLTDLKQYSRVVTLAGVTRYAFSLAIFNLISGTPEPWQIAEHARWLASQREALTFPEEQPTPEQKQGTLFDLTELQAVAQAGRWQI